MAGASVARPAAEDAAIPNRGLLFSAPGPARPARR